MPIDPCDYCGTECNSVEECAERLMVRANAAEARVAELEELLRRALSESHHTDRCPIRFQEPCTCWRRRARAALTPGEKPADT